MDLMISRELIKKNVGPMADKLTDCQIEIYTMLINSYGAGQDAPAGWHLTIKDALIINGVDEELAEAMALISEAIVVEQIQQAT